MRHIDVHETARLINKYSGLPNWATPEHQSVVEINSATGNPIRKRFIISNRSTGTFVAGVYADIFQLWRKSARRGHFYLGDEIIASVELAEFTVCDSGGRVVNDGLY